MRKLLLLFLITISVGAQESLRTVTVNRNSVFYDVSVDLLGHLEGTANQRDQYITEQLSEVGRMFKAIKTTEKMKDIIHEAFELYPFKPRLEDNIYIFLLEPRKNYLMTVEDIATVHLVIFQMENDGLYSISIWSWEFKR